MAEYRGRGLSKNPQIAMRVRELRKQRDWTQKDLAKEAGIQTLDTLVRLEGGYLVSQWVLESIAEAFGITLADLVAPYTVGPPAPRKRYRLLEIEEVDESERASTARALSHV